MEIIKSKGDNCDHVQFAIIEEKKLRKGSEKADLGELEHTQLSSEPKISPASFCGAFPFHLLFDRRSVIQQAGVSISRVVPKVRHALQFFFRGFQLGGASHRKMFTLHLCLYGLIITSFVCLLPLVYYGKGFFFKILCLPLFRDDK